MDQLVVLAVDGSKRSRSALNFLVNHFRSDQPTILVVAVAEQLPRQLQSRSALWGDARDVLDQMQTSARVAAREVAEEVGKILRSKGFTAETTTPVGRPGPEICSLVKERDVDRVILGRQGRSELQEFFLGSTRQYLLHHANCVVTVLPDHG